MVKTYLLAAACAAVLAGTMPVAPAFAAVDAHAGLSDADQLAVEALQAQVEQLIVAHASNPDALMAAIEALATGDGVNPALAAKAVIGALTHPKSAAAQQALADNSALKTAAGQGLGAAIAAVAANDPAIAAAMQAEVAASGDAVLASSVTAGSRSKTASVQRQQQMGQQALLPRDSTPETPASAN